ncbi:hypothetical protein RB199_37715 [Streptomyces libani]|uniref:hypothetical protein n=1 Tax=Streptomyces nigrescens TaxID=1920 RepID=UPI0030537332
MARLGAIAATGAVLLVGGAAATSATAADRPAAATTAAVAKPLPLLAWQRYGNFPYSSCVNWGTTLVNSGNALAWQCVHIGSGIYTLWVLR